MTIGYGDLRIWRASKDIDKLTEVHRIEVPGLTGKCVLVTQDGSAIVSGTLNFNISNYSDLL